MKYLKRTFHLDLAPVVLEWDDNYNFVGRWTLLYGTNTYKFTPGTNSDVAYGYHILISREEYRWVECDVFELFK
jgi:hypothetical protein